MTDEKFIYKPIIDSILTEFKRKRQNIPNYIHEILDTEFIEEKENKIYKTSTKILYSRYVNYLYQATAETGKFRSLVEYIYNSIFGVSKEAFADSKSLRDFSKNPCAVFHLDVDLVDQIVEFDSSQTKPLLFSTKDSENNNTDLQLLYRYINSVSRLCKFFVLYLRITYDVNQHHANIIFGETIDNKIVLNWYEPHGIIDKKISIVLSDLFRRSNNIILSHSEFHAGAQMHSRDRIGYCVMFSLFWIYIVLNIVKYNLENNSYSPSKDWINEVEKYYINSLSSTQMMSIIVSFSTSIFNDYIASLAPKKQKIVLERIKEKIIIDMHNKKFNPFELKSSIVEEEINLERKDGKERGYSRKELIRLAKEDPEHTYESWENARIKEEKEIMKAWEEFKIKRISSSGEEADYVPKLRLGSNCKKNEDCHSGRCKYDEDEKESYCAAQIKR